MARITVEDCLRMVDNRFNLVLKAAKRAHQLELGAADPTVPLDNDKPTVLALREIALGHDITKTRTSNTVEVDTVEFSEVTEAEEVAVVQELADLNEVMEGAEGVADRAAVVVTEEVVVTGDDAVVANDEFIADSEESSNVVNFEIKPDPEAEDPESK